MDKKNEPLDFRKHIQLVVIGAIIGFAPASVTIYLQARFQRQQLFLDRRIAAVKDYSASYSKVASELLPRAERLRLLIKEIKDKELQGDKDIEGKIRVLNEELISYNQQFRVWQADANTQLVVVNAVFDIQLQMFSFSNEGEISPEEKGEVNVRETILRTESAIVGINQHLNNILEKGQANAMTLAARVQQ